MLKPGQYHVREWRDIDGIFRWRGEVMRPATDRDRASIVHDTDIKTGRDGSRILVKRVQADTRIGLKAAIRAWVRSDRLRQRGARLRGREYDL